MPKVAAFKRILKTRTITESRQYSYQRNMELQKQTLFGWLKEKTNFFSEVEENKVSVKRVRIRVFPYENLGKACYM